MRWVNGEEGWHLESVRRERKDWWARMARAQNDGGLRVGAALVWGDWGVGVHYYHGVMNVNRKLWGEKVYTRAVTLSAGWRF